MAIEIVDLFITMFHEIIIFLLLLLLLFIIYYHVPWYPLVN